MRPLVLVTGGAGFIGSHVADELLVSGYEVRALDILAEQVHGAGVSRPGHLHPDVELVLGDIADRDIVRRSLAGVDAVLHLAAAVGVGQSMYEIEHYTRVNNLGTAVLLQALIDRPVRRLVVASSMSIYGEGLYHRSDGAAVSNASRSLAQLREGVWEPRDSQGEPLTPAPTPESKQPSLESLYALSKYDQERMCLILGRAYGIPTLALRLFNVYGPRQALSNPYTGVLAIFASRLLSGKAPFVFEDGRQRRDFVHVKDVARAFRLALESEAADDVFNVGSGRDCTVGGIAGRLAGVMGKPELRAEVTGKFRIGDIRHCFADISRAREALGYEPEVEFDAGLAQLADWLSVQTAVDRAEQASAELTERGLTA
ncbi:MAG TPA: NAD-dependent epimerase/dehydratase family protein [Gemmatimonadaceae bacterium]|nr:NAD-dependent epimerase/dehydratase family protein [Gemmatimonadaceae bacterium]